MTKSDFNLIMDSINERIDGCSKYLDHVHTTDDIKQLTIQEAADLKRFCVDEEPIMTKIAMVDLYHIIGMGNLTPVQMSTFIYKVKDYLKYRPRLKAIVKNLDSIFALPNLPVATRFKLLGLCNLTLTSEFEGEIEDDACIEDYDNLKAQVGKNIPATEFTAELPYRLDGRTIYVDLKQAVEFAAVLTRIFKCPMNVSNFMNRLELKKSYGGIDWISNENGIATGVCSSENNFKKIEAYYRHYSA